ncbi:LysM peptidoglycan-binding domain-containing protein [Coxiella-like endosymbiont]|nr:LysM domain-containing protein [Coxiella-like endosymbiont]
MKPLIHIAHHHVTPQQIYFWNSITKSKKLVVGQKLIILEPSAYKTR